MSDSKISRRGFVSSLASSLALPFLFPRRAAATENPLDNLFTPQRSTENGTAPGGYPSVLAPGIPNLKPTINGGVKEFRLTAEPVTITFPDPNTGDGMGRRDVYVWGYNGSMIGPTIEAVEGDTVRIIVTNHLPDPTTIHWHGLELPIEMDGVVPFSQKPIPPGGSFTYEFTLRQSGTYFYHSHLMAAKQVGLGLMGFFIIHPKNPWPEYFVDHDYAFMLMTWKLLPGSPIPDTLEMTEFNYYTMNGMVGPEIPPMKAKVGEKVRIRVSNLSMLAHPVHLHGHPFKITEWGAGFLPPSQQIPANTINVSAAEVRTLEFVAKYPGKWLFHCHFTHHTMNDMHRPPLPGDMPMDNMPMMDMGGMMTWIEIT